MRRGGTHKEVFTVKCAFMYDIYGIERIEKYSCNKGEYFVSISHIIEILWWLYNLIYNTYSKVK